MALDAIVVGAGPNGLAAAIAIARTGRSVRVYEAEPTIGGSTRSAELTQPGFVHDVCATVHALVVASPFLASLPLADHGLAFAHPLAPVAHPLDDGTAVVVHRSIAETADGLSRRDGHAYRRLIEPLVERHAELMVALLRPLRPRASPVLLRFSRSAVRSALGLARAAFSDDRSRAMFCGVAAHSMVPLDKLGTAGYGLGLLAAAHAVGWPVVRGGSQQLSAAMASYLKSLGGEIVTGARVDSLDRIAAVARRAVRRDAATIPADRRVERAPAISTATGSLSVRSRRVQDGLGAPRARSVARARL